MLTPEEKKAVEKEIVEEIIKGLERDQLSEFDSKQIADFVLTKIDNIEDHAQLIGFLNELARHWPLFDTLVSLEKGKINRETEKEALSSMSELLKQNKIEAALKVAKNINHA